jgi:hypothetical protein
LIESEREGLSLRSAENLEWFGRKTAGGRGEKHSAARAEYDRLAALAWSPRPLKSPRSNIGLHRPPSGSSSTDNATVVMQLAAKSQCNFAGLGRGRREGIANVRIGPLVLDCEKDRPDHHDNGGDSECCCNQYGCLHFHLSRPLWSHRFADGTLMESAPFDTINCNI